MILASCSKESDIPPKPQSNSINKILNLVCEICGVSYMTDFTLVKYCNDCIEKLEMEMDNLEWE